MSLLTWIKKEIADFKAFTISVLSDENGIGSTKRVVSFMASVTLCYSEIVNHTEATNNSVLLLAMTGIGAAVLPKVMNKPNQTGTQ